MCYIRKCILPLVLTVTLVIGTGTPAIASGPGIWVYLANDNTSTTISLINLTDVPLLITSNTIKMGNDFTFQGRTNPPEVQSIPFQGDGQLLLDPYRSAVWKSVSGNTGQPCASCEGSSWWDGQLKLLPQGWDPKWTVAIGFHSQNPPKLTQNGKGTWVSLSVAPNTEWGTVLRDATYGNYYPAAWRYSPDGGFTWLYHIYATQVFDHQLTSGAMWNVFTASGNEMTVSLYSANNRHIVLVIRQTNWDGLSTDYYMGWQLDFVDNNSSTVP